MSEEWPRWMYVDTTSPDRITLGMICKAASEVFDVRERSILSQGRSLGVIRARQAGMALSRTLTTKSYAQIAAFYRRDHTTIMHGVKTVKNLIGVDGPYAQHIRLAKTRAIQLASEAREVDELSEILMDELRKRVHQKIKADPEGILKTILEK